MIIRRIASLAALAAALAAFGSAAQAPQEGVARLKDVKGNVLVSRESGLGAGTEAMRLTEHTRVITTAKSEVTVVYDNGCEVRLKENQRFEVEVGKPCAALIAQAQSILLEPAGAALAGTSVGALVFWSVAPVLGGAAVGLAILQDNRDKSTISPS